MKIIGIMASDPSGAIGLNGALPWYCPDDLKFFETITRDQVMVMGGKTYESLPNKLQRGKIIVFSRKHSYDNVVTVRSMEEFMRCGQYQNEKKHFVIGGAEIAGIFFEMNMISSFILTKMRKIYTADTYLDLACLRKWKKKQLCKAIDYERYLFVKPTIEDDKNEN